MVGLVFAELAAGLVVAVVSLMSISSISHVAAMERPG
jgi:hypothetical protein